MLNSSTSHSLIVYIECVEYLTALFTFDTAVVVVVEKVERTLQFAIIWFI